MPRKEEERERMQFTRWESLGKGALQEVRAWEPAESAPRETMGDGSRSGVERSIRDWDSDWETKLGM